ncbi:MAG: hypothetical protein Q9187_001605 [Circinaria calcarea]
MNTCGLIEPDVDRPQLPPVGYSRFPNPNRLLLAASTKLDNVTAAGNVSEVQNILSSWREPANGGLIAEEALDYFQSAVEPAVRNGHDSVVSYLLDQRIPIDPMAAEVAADRAVETGSTSTLQILLDHGWNINQPFGLTVGSTLRLVVSNEELIKWYLSHGADPNATCAMGRIPMESAAQHAPLAVIRLLISNGANVKSTDVIANAAIAHARGEPGRLEVAEYLLDQGAPVDAFAMQNYTGDRCGSLISILGMENALHHAAKSGKSDMVELLLRKGADREIKSSKGQTALQLAMQKGYNEIVAMLQD